MVPPLSRRGFMTSSAAAAAGYTLARRSGARRRHQDRHQRPHRRRRQGQGRGRRHAGLLRQARQCGEPAGHSRRHGDFRGARIHPRRHPAAGASGRARDRARLLFPRRHRPHQDRRHPEAASDRQRQARQGAVRGSRRHGRLGEVTGRRHQPARHHGLLPRRPHRVALLDPQSEPEGRRRVLRQPWRIRRTRSGRRTRSASPAR